MRTIARSHAIIDEVLYLARRKRRRRQTRAPPPDQHGRELHQHQGVELARTGDRNRFVRLHSLIASLNSGNLIYSNTKAETL